jgi:hypothetical protein
MARPEETINDLPPEWKESVLNLYKEGASDVEVKALICNWRGSISNDLWERWMKEEPEFSETIKRGKLLSEAWWQKEGRTKLSDTKFNYTGWYMNMKNRFGWKDKHELTGLDGKDLIPARTLTKAEAKEYLLKLEKDV